MPTCTADTLWPHLFTALQQGRSLLVDCPQQVANRLNWAWQLLAENRDRPVIWVLPSPIAVQRAWEWGGKQGQVTRQVQVIDGHQTPHEERWIAQQLGNGQPLHCLVSWGALSRPLVGQALLNASQSLLLLTQTEQLLELPSFDAGVNLLSQAGQAQRVIQLSSGGSPSLWETLLERFRLPCDPDAVLWLPLDAETTQLSVKRCVQPQDKARWLVSKLLPSLFLQGATVLERAQKHSVVLLTKSYSEAEDLFELLREENFGCWLGMATSQLSPSDLLMVLEQFPQRDQAILITTPGLYPLAPVPPEQPLTLVSYSGLHSLEAIGSLLAQRPQAASGKPCPPTQLFLLHDKPTFERLRQALLKGLPSVSRQRRREQLQTLRHWLLGETCRKVAWFEATAEEELTLEALLPESWNRLWSRPCGQCDRCKRNADRPYPLQLVKQALNYWLY